MTGDTPSRDTVGEWRSAFLAGSRRGKATNYNTTVRRGISEVRWWLHDTFHDPIHRAAAELVAFGVLEPALRSRGGAEGSAQVLAANEAFGGPMRMLFHNEPTGRMRIPTLEDAMERIAALERRMAALEAKLGKQ